MFLPVYLLSLKGLWNYREISFQSIHQPISTISFFLLIFPTFKFFHLLFPPFLPAFHMSSFLSYFTFTFISYYGQACYKNSGDQAAHIPCTPEVPSVVPTDIFLHVQRITWDRNIYQYSIVKRECEMEVCELGSLSLLYYLHDDLGKIT